MAASLVVGEEWCIAPVAHRRVNLYFVLVCKTSHSIHPLNEIRPYHPDFERTTLFGCQVKILMLSFKAYHETGPKNVTDN